MSYIIIADSPTDLRYQDVDRYQLPLFYIPYIMDGVEHTGDMGRGPERRAFYKALRDGSTPTTSQLTEYAYAEMFERYLQEGTDILFISFPRALSHTIENARAAAKKLLEQYPERRLEIFDCRNVSAGYGQLVLKALQNRENGLDFDGNLKWLQENWSKSNVVFAVDDLNHLKRGGRISATTAIVGKLLDVKPIFELDEAGGIRVVEKVQGRKKALRTLLTRLEARHPLPGESIIIMHGDCEQDAELLKKMVSARLPETDVQIWTVGEIVGTHAGPSVIALAYWGDARV